MSPTLSANRIRVIGVSLLALVLAWLAFAAAAAAAGPEPVFDGKEKWDNWSWGSTTTIDKDRRPYQGKPSLYVQFKQDWAGVSFHKKGFETGYFTHLRFALHGDGGPIPALQAAVHDQNDKIIKLVPIVYYLKPGQNGWYEVSIPLADLNAEGKTISRVSLQQRHGSTKAFYVGGMQFVRDTNAPKKSAAPSAPASEQFTAQVFGGKVLWDDWSWNTKSSLDSHQGRPVLATTYTAAWAGLSFKSDGFVSGYSSLRFAMHANGGAIPSLRAIVYDSSGREIGNVHVTQYITSIDNGWYHVSVPLSALSASDKPISRIALQEGTGSVPGRTFYVNDIRFSQP